MAPSKSDRSPRERLLAAANQLFYQEGVHTVGIDRVIERAGVAKASLYTAFGSKEALVGAYLEARATARRARIEQRIATIEEPREKILAIFDLMRETVVTPTFRGCPFVNASAEEPSGSTRVRRACDEPRAWLRGLLVDLAHDAGALDAERVGRSLALLYDGAVVGAALDDQPEAVAGHARAMAVALLDTLPRPRSARRKGAPR